LRKVAVVTGTRAEYGLSRSAFRAIQAHPELELLVIVTGMHLMEEFGYSCRLIEEDGYRIAFRTDVIQREDTQFAMAETLGRNVIAISKALRDIKPDIMLVLTDLGHTLAGAIAAAHLNIPVAHIHGGDVSGTIDELIRHATTKFSHIHFPASRLSAERIAKMGEERWRIFMCGAPGVDEIKNTEPLDKGTIFRKYRLEREERFILVLQHPVTTEGDVRREIAATIGAIQDLEMRTLIIYPNVDAGGRIIIDAYQALATKSYVDMYKNIPRKDYLSLLKHAACLVGNSSSGIIEAPYFRLPVVNLGSRQRNRERAGNVIDVEPDRHAIVRAVKEATSGAFGKKLDRIKNPYGEGDVGKQIAQVLAEIEINDRLINKVLTY
jgi:UDP-N-acetylglucosamine 2-epimerase (non-hydrolysing)/GDP/UDP-N,N'-diacetylbacillosamine 2-epimerase (hydrolysing)